MKTRTKENNEDFKKFTERWICENGIKVRDHCLITGKYRVSAHRDCHINVKSQNSCGISQPKKL